NDDACSSATLTVVVAGPVTGQTDIAIGVDALPLLAYQGSGGVTTVHCTTADCTQRTTAALGVGSTNLSLAIATNGLGLIAIETQSNGFPSSPPRVLRCVDVACSSATLDAGTEPILANSNSIAPSLAVPADGRPLLGYMQRTVDPLGDTFEMHVHRCADVVCTGHVPSVVLPLDAAPVVGVQPSGLGWFVHAQTGGFTRLQKCTDAACSSTTSSCLTNIVAPSLSLAAATDGRPLVALYRQGGGPGGAYDF